MKQEVKIGQADYTILVLIRDTAGAPKTGLTNASAGLDMCYTRAETDNDVVLTAGAPVALATPALTDVHLDWGFLEVDATNAPGLYRLDLPDGVFASGAWSAVVSIIGTGLDPTHLEFVLVPESPYVGVDVKSIGGTAQTPNDVGADVNDILVDTAVIGALGAGLTALATQASVDGITAAVITNAAGADVAADIIAVKAETAELKAAVITNAAGVDIAADIIAVKADTAAILVDTGTTLDERIPAALVGGRMDASIGAVAAGVIAAASFAANALDAVWSTAVRILTAATNITSTGGTTVPQTGDSFARLGAPAGVSMSADLAAVHAKTTNLPTDPADESLIIAATDAIMTRLGAPAGASVAADVAAVKSDTAAVLADTGTDGVVVASASKTGYALSTAGVDAVLDDTIGDGTITARQALRVILAALAGKLSGAATATITIRNLADSANVVVATVDADGNRSAVTVTP